MLKISLTSVVCSKPKTCHVMLDFEMTAVSISNCYMCVWEGQGGKKKVSLSIIESNLPATQKHPSWSQNHPIQNNFQRTEHASNSLHSRCFSFYLKIYDAIHEFGMRKVEKKQQNPKWKFTSSLVAGTGARWWDAWNMLKWYRLEFWNQIANWHM